MGVCRCNCDEFKESFVIYMGTTVVGTQGFPFRPKCYGRWGISLKKILLKLFPFRRIESSKRCHFKLILFKVIFLILYCIEAICVSLKMQSTLVEI